MIFVIKNLCLKSGILIVFVLPSCVLASAAQIRPITSPSGQNNTIPYADKSTADKLSIVPLSLLLAHPGWKLLPSKSVCGFPLKPIHNNDTGNEFLYRRKRVAGGRMAYAGEIPGIGLINMRYPGYDPDYEGPYSGGTAVLISTRYLLTTASAIKAIQTAGNVVHSVLLRRNQMSDNQYSYRIDKVIFHKNFEDGVKANDIALLRLAKKVNFTTETNPICLPDVDDDEFNTLQQEWSTCLSNLIGAGWGLTAKGSETTPLYMNYIEMKLRPNQHCDRVYSRDYGRMAREKLCVSSCLGEHTGLCGDPDMGSGLLNSVDQLDGQKQYTLFGLASHFADCGIQSLPVMYTNVRHYLPWILDSIRP